MTVFSSVTLLKVNRYITSLLLIALFAAGASACQQNTQSTMKRPPDKQITSAVQNKLKNLNGLKKAVNNIKVSTHAGVVTLKGETANLLTRERATRLAENVKGVRSVINNLNVASTRPDNEIEMDVDNALSTDPATEDMEVNATVKNGLVTLKGVASSWQESQLAGKIVKSVRGVQAVQNNLIVHYNTGRSPRDIQAEVKHMLRWDARLDDAKIKVNVTSDKIVNLSGQVGSAYQKDLAMQVAHVRGVEDVQAQHLEVEPAITGAMRRDPMSEDINDGQITAAIKDAMTYDPRVTAEDVQVRVEDGRATLSGTVFNLNEKLAAGEDAHNTMGVEQVSNNISVERRVVVRPAVPTTDEAIADRVEAVFVRDPYVSPVNIEVKVNRGVVSLSGTARTRFLKTHYRELASKVKGVIAVQSDISVPSSGNNTG